MKDYKTIHIPTRELMVGDLIADKINERGKVLTVIRVKVLDRRTRGGLNVHVNGNLCYDRWSYVDVCVEGSQSKALIDSISKARPRR